MADENAKRRGRIMVPAATDQPPVVAPTPLLSRRVVLAGALGLGTMAGCNSSEPRRGLLGLTDRLNERAQGGLFRPKHRAVEVAHGKQTSDDEFPVYHIAETVPLAPANWSLKIGGMVRTPGLLSLDELRRMSRTDMRVRHYCVEGWSAVAAWHGVRVRDIAERVGADPRAGFVEFRSFDEGYWSSWDRDSALHPQSLLAYGMNGNDLSPAHGAPLRLYSATKLGYKQVKYLSEVNFLPQQTGGYWEQRGYEWFAGV